MNSMRTIFPDICDDEIIDQVSFDSSFTYRQLSLVKEKLGDFAARCLKKDLSISHCLILLKDVIVIEVIMNAGSHAFGDNKKKIEQVYYFKRRGEYTCLGEVFWPSYHYFRSDVMRFVDSLRQNEIPLNDLAVFIGGRDNFTHAFMDYAPSALMIEGLLPDTSIPLYTGVRSHVQDLAYESMVGQHFFNNREGLKAITVKLSDTLSVRLSRYNRLFAIRHLSIFTLTKMVRERIHSEGYQNLVPEVDKYQRTAIMRDTNDRILNQQDVLSQLVKSGIHPYHGIHMLPIKKRIDLLKNAREIVVPPGSDNVNAILFTRDSCEILQMLCMPKHINQLQRRLFYYSGVRYLLPVLSRLKFWIASRSRDLLAGEWETIMRTNTISELLNGH
jgi:hypothetical protein